MQHELCFRIYFISTGFLSVRQLSLVSSFHSAVFPYYLQLEGIFLFLFKTTHTWTRPTCLQRYHVKLKGDSGTHELTHNMCKGWCCLGQILGLETPPNASAGSQRAHKDRSATDPHHNMIQTSCKWTSTLALFKYPDGGTEAGGYSTPERRWQGAPS